jgi:glutaredoxin
MATKSWLKKQGHEFTEYNISENEEYADRLLQLGAKVTPVIMVDDQMIIGYSPIQLEQALS